MPRDAGGTRHAEVRVDAADRVGPLELWRHGVGLGGINSRPLPERVVRGARALRPRLVRVFIQEFFGVYPEHGRFDWTRLDAYLGSVARTGARIVAAICIKPPPLFPVVDHARWRPTDRAEWQEVVRALVRRYSVERQLVTHWEVGNETDIGEGGGSPYLIPDPADYVEFYDLTCTAILDAWPGARVGGPASCWVTNEPLPGLVDHCRATGTQLDFVSWHLYSDDAARHAAGVTAAKGLLAGYPGRRPELMVTEWSKGFESVSVAEDAGEPRRAALVAAAILAMDEAGVDRSFYYHLWDQTAYPDEFATFFSAPGVDHMLRHWNEVPHRFGLFGVDGEVRPQYFVFWMIARLGADRLRAGCSDGLRMVAAGGADGGAAGGADAAAANGADGVQAMLVNPDAAGGPGRVATVEYRGLPPGEKRLVQYRIDTDRRWSEDTLQMRPVETRTVATRDSFRHQVLLPPGSVTLVLLQPTLRAGRAAG